MFYLFVIVLVVIVLVFLINLKKNDVTDYTPKGQVRPSTYKHTQPDSSSEFNSSGNKVYKTINFAVKGITYRSPLEIQIAKNIKVGDVLLLKHELNNPKDAYAIKVLTSTAAHIGYVEKQYSQVFFKLLKSINRCVVTKVADAEVPFIYADVFIEKSAYYKAKLDLPDKLEVGREIYVGDGVSFKISTPRSKAIENNSDLAYAEKIKYDHPEKAVDIFIRSAADEDGLYSIHQACICYRRMKDYDSELKLIHEILLVCKEEGLNDSIATYESRLRTVEKLIANRNKKINSTKKGSN